MCTRTWIQPSNIDTEGEWKFVKKKKSKKGVGAPDRSRSTSSSSVRLSSDAAIREGAYELRLRADEVGTLRAFNNLEQIEFERWRPSLVDADWHAFCQAIYKGIERENWEELYCHYRDMSKGNRSQKAT